MNEQERIVELLHWKTFRFVGQGGLIFEGQGGLIFEGTLTQASEEAIADIILKAGYTRQPEPPADKVEQAARRLWYFKTGATMPKGDHPSEELLYQAREILALFPEPWDREQTIYEDGFNAGRKSWLLESKPTEPPADKVEAVCRALFDVWVEAKSTMPDGDNWNDVTWDSLPEKHQAEYIKTAKRIIALFPEPEPELLTDEEAKKAIFEHRQVLAMNGHTPRTQDSRQAIAQAQLDKDRKAIRGEKC